MVVSGLGLVWNTIPEIPWNVWEKPEARSVRAKIQTGNLQYRNQMSYLLSQLPRWHMVVFMMMMWHACSVQAIARDT